MSFSNLKLKTKEQDWYAQLENLDFIDIKKTAYTISKYASLLAKEERQIRLLNELNEDLSKYKYKKEVSANFSKEIKNKFTIFMDTIDV